MKKEKQFELLLNLPAIIRQNNAPEPEDFDDARFFVKQGNILWIYHDEDAPEENTICRYELAMEDFVVILEDFLRNGDVGCIFNDMEEKCTAHTSVTIENPLYQKLEKTFNEKIGFIGAGRSKETLCELIKAVYQELQYADICKAGYDDAFFVDHEGKRVTWMYYNPDSIEGGQFVNNEVSFLQILEAAEKESNVEEFFCCLGSIAYQTLEDIGTVEFEAEKNAFFQEPTLKDLTEETMMSLIKIAKGDKKE